MFKQLSFLLLYLLFSGAKLIAQPRKIMLSPKLKEISGLCTAPDGTLWALNDSGNTSELFNLNANSGQIIKVVQVSARNRDWEELTISPDGILWIGDFGNNSNARRDLRVYRFNPQNGHLDSLLFHYPDQTDFPPEAVAAQRFDCEAMVWSRDTLHLFTKSRFAGQHVTYHYTLPARPGQYVATLIDSLYLPNLVVTGAALSNDHRTLALTAYHIQKRKYWLPRTRASLCLISTPPDTLSLSGKMRKKRLPKSIFSRQFESVSQDAKGDWRVANEQRAWQRMALWHISFTR